MQKSFLIALITLVLGLHSEIGLTQVWKPLGEGLGKISSVNCFALDSTTNTVYVGGAFDRIAGCVADGMAYSNGGAWKSLKPLFNPPYYQSIKITSMAFFQHKLYAAWNTPYGDDVVVYPNRIASWDGHNWQALFIKPGAQVVDMIAFQNKLILAVSYTSNPDTAEFFSWDGTNISRIYGLTYIPYYLPSFHFIEDHDSLFISGLFNGGIEIARFDNDNKWIPVLTSLDGSYYPDIFKYHNQFITLAGNTLKFINGPNETSLLTQGAHNIEQILTFHDSLYAITDSGALRYLSKYDNVKWKPIARFADSTTEDSINFAGEENNQLFIGGTFTYLNDTTCVGFASYDGKIWKRYPALYAGSGDITDLACDSANHYLYAAGQFDLADGKTANNIARWDGKNWSSLGTGLLYSYYPESFAGLAARNDSLFVFLRDFTSNILNDEWIWDGKFWKDCSATLQLQSAFKVYNIASNIYLITGNKVKGSVQSFAHCNWTPVGQTFSSSVNALCWFKGKLYAAGDIEFMNGYSLGYLDGMQWTGQVSFTENVLDMVSYHDSLIVSIRDSGIFKSSDGANWQRICNDPSTFHLKQLYVFQDQLLALDQDGRIRIRNGNEWDVLLPDEGSTYTASAFDSSFVIGGFFYDLNDDQKNIVGIAQATPIPDANFVLQDSDVCSGNSVLIQNEAQGFYTKERWLFSDSNRIQCNCSQHNPVLIFDSSGYYTISHTIYSPFGNDSITKSYNITVSKNPNVIITGLRPICRSDTLVLTAHGANNYEWSFALILGNGVGFDSTIKIVNSYNSAQVSVIGLDLNGCSDTSTGLINVLPPYDLSILYPVGDLCPSDTAVLTSYPYNDSNLIYSWSPSSSLSSMFGKEVIASPLATTTYTLTASDTSTKCIAMAYAKVPVNEIFITKIIGGDSVLCPSNKYGVPLMANLNINYPYQFQWVFNSDTILGATGSGIFVNEPGIYSLEITNECGRSDTLNYRLYKDTLPTPIVLKPLPEFCYSKGVIELPDVTPSGGLFDLNGLYAEAIDTSEVNHEFEMPDYITYQIPDFYGCLASATDTFYVDKGPVVFISSLKPFCENSPPYQLEDGYPTDGIYSGDGVISGVFYPSLAGIGSHTITYVYTDTVGCSNSASTIAEVNTCTEVSNLETSLNFEVNPNPAREEINLSFSNFNIENGLISITDISGEEVFRTENINLKRNQSFSLNISHLPPGLYMVRMKTANFYGTKRFVKI